MSASDRTDLARRNSRAFVWFRILFNCRFYYPVYAILFLDLGLSVGEFALLNAIWAATIVILELPSGALADQIGRRRLVAMSGYLMVAEMALLFFMPAHSVWTFPLFVLNRLISGAGEALASGADEALTYDSLPEESREGDWRRLNARLIQWQSIGFVVASVAGALLYDAGTVNRLGQWLGGLWELEKSQTLRIPLGLNLITALLTLRVALQMRDPVEPPPPRPFLATCRSAWRETVTAASWIWRTPAAFSLLMIGLFFDSLIRLFYTVASSFYRLIEIPDAMFGFVGAVAALTGILSARLAERLVAKATPSAAIGVVSLLAGVGCAGMALAVPKWGILLIAPFWFAMRLTHYFLTTYLNKVTPSERRATVLSFRGLTMNLAYGLLTLAYGWQTAWLAGRLPEEITGDDQRNARVFGESVAAWPFYFLAAGAIVWLLLRWKQKGPLTDAVARAGEGK